MGYKRPIQLYISADKNGSASIDDYYSISNEAVFAPSLKFFSKKNPTLDVAEIRAVTNATATAPDITQSEHGTSGIYISNQLADGHESLHKRIGKSRGEKVQIRIERQSKR